MPAVKALNDLFLEDLVTRNETFERARLIRCSSPRSWVGFVSRLHDLPDKSFYMLLKKSRLGYRVYNHKRIRPTS